ncbi:MAG: hypothetical protein K2N65_06135, partial [Anaeroplasmataceae bacterium]|nr:hypothetical protein [Anaeroplasmataceae bacterium]
MKLKQVFAMLIMILLTASIILENKLPMVKYFDEVLTLGFIVVTFVSLLFKKTKIPREDGMVFLGWLILVAIGVLSNLTSKIDRKAFDIVLDILSFSKLFVFIACTKCLFQYETVNKMFDSSVKLCKILTVVMFILSIANIFFNFGMRGQKRFGIYGFNFVFEYAHEFTVFVLCIYIILFLKLKKKKQRRIYSLMICFILLITLKGPSMLIPFVFLGVRAMIKYKDKLKVLLILVFLLSICIWISRYQIVTYLTNVNAPRYILFKHGFITATHYLPFGSGFGTYGSSVAASSYSPLYEQYGFTSLYGMNPEDYQFLNDTYYPMIIGQFGFFGTALMFGIFVFFITKCLKCHDKSCKIIAITILTYFIIHSVGSAILTSSAGVLGIIFLSFIWIYDKG